MIFIVAYTSLFLLCQPLWLQRLWTCQPFLLASLPPPYPSHRILPSFPFIFAAIAALAAIAATAATAARAATEQPFASRADTIH
jgi:hypothetical protein